LKNLRQTEAPYRVFDKVHEIAVKECVQAYALKSLEQQQPDFIGDLDHWPFTFSLRIT